MSSEKSRDAMVITRVGNEGLAGPALDYLTKLGVPAEDIKGIRIDAPVNGVQTVTVTLVVRSAGSSS